MTSPWRDRLRRADEHLEEVERETQRFLASKPYRVVGKMQPNPLTRKVVNYEIRGQVVGRPDSRFGHVIGDFIENARSALDLIAFRLAHDAGTPANGTEFPIFWNPADYHRMHKGQPSRGSGRYKIRSMAPNVQAVIERLQPYIGIDPADFKTSGPNSVPEGVLRHPLYIVHAMRQENFHREPHVTGAIAKAGMVFHTLRDLNIVMSPTGPHVRVGAFNDGAPLGFVQFAVNGPNPVVEMDLNPTYDVAFDPEGPARGQPVVRALRHIRDHIQDVVFPQLEPLV